ncbi:related to transport protein USO1 [Fusarium torulosum]|uniref:Related to transport protein USO1 n=1 Tax=Fusarium torulosum TaxID=33205 RepID=A0AAE8MGF2_9HYPO|nr:related to transport protein USO1 [Fusarium torulosum]
MFSIASAPAKQSVGETIDVLSGRLSSATLLEDRRAAILGLRSFAKDYPASVASGALRSLIGSLSKDGEDVDTVKVVLETLLMLFNPNEDSPEASEEIALWLADEFTQRQENITLLLDFLDTNDFYSRLYSLQLLAAILSARTERTEECIFTAPLGIPRLVSILDDQRDAIRNEAIILLTYLTPTSIEIQKLVAFENAFERLFAIIEGDGALVEGGRTVEDCLILLANLLRSNSSNQALFRESGCMNRLTDLLGRVLTPQTDGSEIASWAAAQRNRNVYAFLAVVRLFIVRGAAGTSLNQTAIWKHGLAYHILQLAFSHEAQTQIKAEALITCGDVIRQNAPLQEAFAQMMVSSPLTGAGATDGQTSQREKIFVIDGLLDLTLCLQELQEFDVRFAASECLQAYFANHPAVKLHFLGRAIEGHQSGANESSNVLTVLLQPSSEVSDPYRQWFAAVITFHLVHENSQAKTEAMSLTEGDSEDGEEVVTGIQTLSAHVTSGLRRDDDARVLIGYLMLLLGWLFEDLDAVNDFLAEGSNVQSLIQAVSQPPAIGGGELVQGLCTMLLGVAYEFSTKDSPIPRATLLSIITSRIDRDLYLNRLSKLRSHPFLRDFEVLPQKLDTTSPGRLPDVFFDRTFVEFFKDNYNRIARAIDREPGIEISVVTDGVQKGVSRELVDSLRSQVEEKQQIVSEIQETLTVLQGQLGQEQADHRRSKELAAVELQRVKTVNEGLQKHHTEELRKLQSQLATKENDQRRQIALVQSQYLVKENDYQKQIAQLRSQQTALESDHQKKLEQVRKTSEAEAEKVKRRTDAEIADLKATISRLEVVLMKSQKEYNELQTLRKKDIDMQREKYEEAMRHLREDKEKEIEDLKAQSKARADENHELRGLCEKKDAEMSAFQAQAKDELEEQRLKTQQAEEKYESLEKQLSGGEAGIKGLEDRLKKMEMELSAAKEAKDVVEKQLSELKEVAEEETKEARKAKAVAEKQLSESKEARETTQSELDDLLMVFGDLEEKVAKYKTRLVGLGEAVSDDDDEDDEDDEDGSEGDGSDESEDQGEEEDEAEQKPKTKK